MICVFAPSVRSHVCIRAARAASSSFDCQTRRRGLPCPRPAHPPASSRFPERGRGVRVWPPPTLHPGLLHRLSAVSIPPLDRRSSPEGPTVSAVLYAGRLLRLLLLLFFFFFLSVATMLPRRFIVEFSGAAYLRPETEVRLLEESIVNGVFTEQLVPAGWRKEGCWPAVGFTLLLKLLKR